MGWVDLLLLALAVVALGVVATAFAAWRVVLWMPGRSFGGRAPALSDSERARRDRLHADISALADRIGERNVSHRPEALDDAADYIERTLVDLGYAPTRDEFPSRGHTVCNIEVECAGASGSPGAPRWIVGAHYDTVPGSPGANDNASAVAAALELARAFRDRPPRDRLRVVFFANEESPYFMTDECGSLRHARRCRERGERVAGMFCLETIGCFTDAPGSQRYPPPLNWFFPSTGNFIAFVGNVASRRFVRRALARFRRHANLPSEGVAAPMRLRDVCRSDHYAFWLHGYPAVMVTDTANFRYEHYHRPTDTPDRLNFADLARLVGGLEAMLADLAGAPPHPAAPDSA